MTNKKIMLPHNYLSEEQPNQEPNEDFCESQKQNKIR